MLVEFRSTAGDSVSSTNSALGEVVLSTCYNSASPFTTSSSKSALMNEEFAVSTKPSHSVIHAIECAPTQTPMDKLYTRSSASGVNPPASGTDIRLYDLGSLAVATFGQQAASVTLGELWITYEVILFKPRTIGAQVPPVVASIAGSITVTPPTLPTAVGNYLVSAGTTTQTVLASAFTFSATAAKTIGTIVSGVTQFTMTLVAPSGGYINWYVVATTSDSHGFVTPTVTMGGSSSIIINAGDDCVLYIDSANSITLSPLVFSVSWPLVQRLKISQATGCDNCLNFVNRWVAI